MSKPTFIMNAYVCTFVNALLFAVGANSVDTNLAPATIHNEAGLIIDQEARRLSDIARSFVDFEEGILRDRYFLRQRADKALFIRRQVRDMLARKEVDAQAADLLYDQLRVHLRASRDELAKAISDTFASSRVPMIGEGQLNEIPSEVDTAEVVQLRNELENSRRRLLDLEANYREDRGAQLYNEVRDLNTERLALLPKLSAEKRKRIKGISLAAFDQAGAELRQIALVLRYHVIATRDWIADAIDSRGRSFLVTALVIIKWLLVFFAFRWLQRLMAAMLHTWRTRLNAEQQKMRLSKPPKLFSVICFIEETNRPLAWLAFSWAIVWMLPAELRGHLEIKLIAITFTWILAGSFVVKAIDTLAGQRAQLNRHKGAMATDQIRLRSLQLAGRTVVVLGLIMAIGEQLVGRGTIYGWVFALCWVAAIPVVLIVVKWWRETIFNRISSVRKKKSFHQWVVKHQTGWKSFLAAVSAGVYLFVAGSIRVARGWLGRFDFARRAHAYLFRRGIDRLADEKKFGLALRPLDNDLFALLGPETFSTNIIPDSADEKLKEIGERIDATGGGVFAVVGERGRGKTTVLKLVCERNPGMVVVDCPPSGLEGLRQALAAALDLASTATLEECAAKIEGLGENSGILIDHAHRLVSPVMGGLAPYDEVMRIARAFSLNSTWFFAFNAVIWKFLERARGAKPQFDDTLTMGPWSEEEIARLLQERCRQASIEPAFDLVMDELPSDADDIDKSESLDRVSYGYFRMIWDYSAGNAGVALHTWRSSLGVDENGKICVKLFKVPDASDLEQMPNYVVFILRAVIQLEPACIEEIVNATLFSVEQVSDVLRYGVVHGYFSERDGRYQVTWEWFRPITNFLRRRHLLAKI